jgi:hypothetical protein
MRIAALHANNTCNRLKMLPRVFRPKLPVSSLHVLFQNCQPEFPF